MAEAYIGTMGWSYKFWLGNFYPDNLPTNQFLAEYSKHFRTVEVDSTFYSIPNEAVVENWKQQTSPDFLFSLKFPRIITHQKMLKDCEQETQFFIERASNLQGKLGPLLLQFPPNFGPAQVNRLQDFLRTLPQEHRYAVEIRNKELLNDELYSLLALNKVALVLVDHPSLPMLETITADFTYIRWEGDRKKINPALGKVQADRTNDNQKWTSTISQLLTDKVNVFGYFSKYYSGHPPTDVTHLLKLLEKRTS